MNIALQAVPTIVGRSTGPVVRYRDQADLKPSDSSSMVCFEQAFSARETNEYFFHQSEALLFRHVAQKALGLAPPTAPACKPDQLKVLFLQRPHPLPRPLWNADELLEELRVQGFTDVTSTSLSESTPYFQQAALFYAADVVISIHGSQLGNLIFMREGTTVVEIFPHKYLSSQPWTLSRVLKATHHQMLSNDLPPQELVEERNPAYLPELVESQRLSRKFADTASCYADPDCR